VAIDPDAIGRRVVGDAYEVTAERTIRFAEAVNDHNPHHLAGSVAHPVFALNPVLKTMAKAKRQACSAFGFHGEHDIVWQRPIVPGMMLVPEAEIVGLRQRRTGVTIITRVRSQWGAELVNEQYFVSFLKGESIPNDAGQDAPSHGLPAEVIRRTPDFAERYPLDPDQTRRYADASGDHDAYTIDEAAARAMGFPTLLVHGMCTMALCGRFVVDLMCGGDTRRLRRLAVRLSKPVFLHPGQAIDVVGWQLSPGRFGFEARERHGGEAVVTNGYAELFREDANE